MFSSSLFSRKGNWGLHLGFLTLILGLTLQVNAATQISVDPAGGHKMISPLIYGKCNNLSDNPTEPLLAADWQKYRDAGIKFFRESNGNNSTKYNFRRKLGSHPDWYNTVHPHDWDFAAQSLQENMPGIHGLWAVQLIGWTAMSGDANFDCWAYDQCAGGNRNENWTGNGDINLYLEPWPVDSSVLILDHWFGPGGLGLNFEQFKYWNTDNEADIWGGTHDDVYPDGVEFEDFFQKYVHGTKLMRQMYPDIKIVGPVFTNEWQWFNWESSPLTDPATGTRYNLTEYFFKRLAQAEDSLGLQLLDIYDLHWYPEATAPAEVVQLHRVLFDDTYIDPNGNGIHRLNGGWEPTTPSTHIMKRARDWSMEYLGREVGMGMTEYGRQTSNQSLSAINYASFLGTFANEGVEMFSPWSWEQGYWEVLHLFSNYAGAVRVNSVSDNDSLVSGYSSVNSTADTLTVMIVNRNLTGTESVTLNLSTTSDYGASADLLQLSGLSGTTFVSASDNALVKTSANLSGSSLTVSVPALSITAARIPIVSNNPVLANQFNRPLISNINMSYQQNLLVFSNTNTRNLDVKITNLKGESIQNLSLKPGISEFSMQHLSQGLYVVRAGQQSFKFMK
jgi:hypothetical protein